MLFLEAHVRALLVLHTLCAVALVGAATHLVLWMRRYRNGNFARHRAVQKFAGLTFGLYLMTFLVGNLLYPTYKIRVRAEYLENPGAITRDLRQRQEERARILPSEKFHMQSGDTGQPHQEVVREAEKMARWFDVKEHWTALGMMLSGGCFLTLCFWDPRKHGDRIAGTVMGLAIATAATTWLGAIIGVVVSSYRSIAGPG